MELGEKILRRRKELGLTQAALAGKQITRNMLCAIERGTATPSLATMQYLSEKLEMPMGWFFCPEEEEFFYRKQRCFPHLSALYRIGSYAECLRTFEKELGECDDELGLMMAVCAFECGKRAWHNGAFESADAYLTSAEDYARETAYPTDWIHAGCRVLIPIAVNVQSPLLEFNRLGYIDSLRRAGCLDVFFYLSEQEDYIFENRLYADHLAARRKMKDGQYRAALEILTRIEEQKGAPEMSAFLIFRAYGDLEVAYRETGDYEAAYRYSSKRMTLLTAFHS